MAANRSQLLITEIDTKTTHPVDDWAILKQGLVQDYSQRLIEGNIYKQKLSRLKLSRLKPHRARLSRLGPMG